MRVLMTLRLAVVALLSIGFAPIASAQNPSIWAQVQQTGVLRIGLIPNRPPYQWEKGGKLIGMSITIADDLAKALEKELGRPVRIENVITSWATLILDLQSNRVDAFVGLTATEERKKAVSMIGPLYAIPVVAVTPGSSKLGENWEDLNKPTVTVSVTTGTSDEDAARKFLPKATVRSHKAATEAILDVLSGNSQAFITALLIGAPLMQSNPNLGKMIILKPAYALPSGAAARPDADGRFAAFADAWAKTYKESGRARDVVLDAVKESGFDLTRIEGGASF